MENYRKNLFTIGLLSFSNSIPLYLATFALPGILRKAGASLVIIGLFGGLMLPWALKFLWAPLLDKFYSQKSGRRKSWLIPSQGLIALCLFLLAFGTPENNSWFCFILIIIMLMAAATHYLATSAFIYEQLPPESISYGNYALVVGTALGSFAGGGLFMILYANCGWLLSILFEFTVVVIILLGICFLIRENSLFVADHAKVKSASILNFIKNAENRKLLYLCLTYRGCEGLVMGMQQPFLIDRGISLSMIGSVIGISGVTVNLFSAGIISRFLSNVSSHRYWLLILGLLRTVCYSRFMLLAIFANSNTSIIFSIVVVNMACRAMEMVVLYTIFMRNLKSEQVATDIAILLCAEIIIYSCGMMSSGFVANYCGYAGLFLIGSSLSLITTYNSFRLLKINKKIDVYEDVI